MVSLTGRLKEYGDTSLHHHLFSMEMFDQKKFNNLVILKDYFQRFRSSILTLSFGLNCHSCKQCQNGYNGPERCMDIMHGVQSQPLDQIKSLGSCQQLAVEPHNSSTIAVL